MIQSIDGRRRKAFILTPMDMFTTDPDARLMLDFAQGDDSAFDLILRKYKGMVFGVAWRYCGGHAGAEDIAQEVFLRIYLSRNTYKPRSKLSTWIYRITVNLCLNELRSRKHTEVLPETAGHSVPGGGDAAAALEKEQLGRAVRDALDALPERQRIVVLLHKHEGLSYQEIAEVLECSASAVDSLMQRARQGLKDSLGKYIQE